MFELAKAKEKLHILEGLIIALDNIDEVIAVIKASESVKTAAEELMARFGLSEAQTKAILEMRLQRLTGLERDKIREEHIEISALVKELEDILAEAQKVLDIIIGELEDIQKRYGDTRRTEIVLSSTDIGIEDMIVEEDMVVTISHQSYIKRNPVSLYRSQHRGGRGKVGMGTKEDDFLERMFIASTHSHILFFTNLGRVYWLKIYQIPQAGRAAKGKAIVNLIGVSKDEKITAVLPVKEFIEDKFVIMATKRGIIKKTDLIAYSNPRTGGIIALTLDEGDELIDARITEGDNDIILATRNGFGNRFHETDVRAQGRNSQGVIGIRLRNTDQTVSMLIVKREGTLLSISENGYGKRTPIADYRVTKRGSMGVITLKTTKRNGNLVSVQEVIDDDDLIIITNSGKVIRQHVGSISVISRNTQGMRLITLNEGDKVTDVARVAHEEEEDISENDENGNGIENGKLDEKLAKTK